jgi:hypothetical protein
MLQLSIQKKVYQLVDERYQLSTFNFIQDCSKLGSAVPAYFGLLKFYIVAICLAILINGIYPLWATYYVCTNYITLGKSSCLDVGIVYYIDFNIELELLTKNNNFNIAQVLPF